MSTCELTIESLKEKYQEYLYLNYVKSKSDSDEEPFVSKYNARKIIESQIEQLKSNELQLNETDDSEFAKSIEVKHLIATYKHFMRQLDSICMSKYSLSARRFLVLALFEYNLGKNYTETEEIELGQKVFSKLVKKLEDLTLNENLEQIYNPVLFNLKLNCLMELIIIWSFRSDYNKCIRLLSEIDQLYEVYKKESVKNQIDSNEFSSCDFELVTMPFDLNELISIDTKLTNANRKANFESIYTHSLFYAAQVYGKLEEKDKSAYYCQLTLQRQMDQHNEKSTQETDSDTQLNTNLTSLSQQIQEKVSFNPLDWATHAAALSQYYVCQNDFATARHCLCCTDAILEKLNSENTDSTNEKLIEQTQSIKRCWGKYAIELLKVSKARLLESTYLPDQKSLLSEIDKPSRFHFNLPTSEFNLDKSFKESITSNLALDYEQARTIFLKGITILNNVRDYFKIDGFVTDHCEISRDISELYGCLIFFEEDLDRRCKMQKRRLDLLTPVCDEISEQFYLTLKRQLLFDVGTIYSEMMDTKLDIFKEKKEKNALSQEESKTSIVKINQLALKGIKIFESFLDTMKVMPKKECLPEKFDDHNVRPALLAKFYIGRFYSKLITLEPKKRLENMKATLENYSYLVEYCEKHKNDNSNESIDQMINEYNVCKEMIVFLPGQMDKLRSQI